MEGSKWAIEVNGEFRSSCKLDLDSEIVEYALTVHRNGRFCIETWWCALFGRWDLGWFHDISRCNLQQQRSISFCTKSLLAFDRKLCLIIRIRKVLAILFSLVTFQ